MKKVINYNLQRLQNFKFTGKWKQHYCRVHMRKSFTNIFITLTDLQDKVIHTTSIGQFSKINNKRVKLSPVIYLKMIRKFFQFMRKLKFRKYEMILRSRFGHHLITFVRESLYYGLRPFRLINRRIVAHNGVRARHIRRI